MEGYIGRSEIEYVLSVLLYPFIRSVLICGTGKARRTRDVFPETLCTFTAESVEEGVIRDPFTGTEPALGIDEDEAENIVETSTPESVINMWPWINQVRLSIYFNTGWLDHTRSQTPLTVSPQLPLEMGMQLFKRMG